MRKSQLHQGVTNGILLGFAGLAMSACGGSSETPFSNGQPTGGGGTGNTSLDAAPPPGPDARGSQNDAVDSPPDVVNREDGGNTSPPLDARADRASLDARSSFDATIGDAVRADGAPGDASRDADAGVTRDAGNPGGPLDGQRWDLPCTGPSPQGPGLCSDLPPGSICTNDFRPVEKSVTFGGEVGRAYAVTLRLRGVVELTTCSGGMAGGDFFYIGGMPSGGAYNAFGLSVSAPPGTYYLNASSQGVAGLTVVDETETVVIDGGATVGLFVADSDCTLIRNCMMPGLVCTPFVVPGVAPAPNQGQFIQMNVVSVVAQ